MCAVTYLTVSWQDKQATTNRKWDIWPRSSMGGAVRICFLRTRTAPPKVDNWSPCSCVPCLTGVASKSQALRDTFGLLREMFSENRDGYSGTELLLSFQSTKQSQQLEEPRAGQINQTGTLHHFLHIKQYHSDKSALPGQEVFAFQQQSTSRRHCTAV